MKHLKRFGMGLLGILTLVSICALLFGTGYLVTYYPYISLPVGVCLIAYLMGWDIESNSVNKG